MRPEQFFYHTNIANPKLKNSNPLSSFWHYCLARCEMIKKTMTCNWNKTIRSPTLNLSETV